VFRMRFRRTSLAMGVLEWIASDYRSGID